MRKKIYHKLVDFARPKCLSPRLREEYEKITSNGDTISKQNFTLPTTIERLYDKGGKIYADHLLVNEKNGTASIKLNSWEESILEEERRREDFVCWIRNFSRHTNALCLPYKINNEVHAMYPDLLIVRGNGDGYVVDILEPHDPSRRDNLAKAKGFAEYSKAEPKIERIQMIRKDATKNIFRRLNIAESFICEKVLPRTRRESPLL